MTTTPDVVLIQMHRRSFGNAWYKIANPTAAL